MAGSFTNFLELEILDHVFGNQTFTASSNVFVGLSTTPISDDGSGITEPTNGYARVQVANNKTTWTVAQIVMGIGELFNDIPITFPSATGSWGEVTHFFIADASSGGNIYGHGDLNVSKVINSGDTAEFAQGDLVIRLD